MSKIKAIFRVDASSFIGGGHVMRCLTLADEMSNSGWHCRFACTQETVDTMPVLLGSGYEIMTPDELGESAELLIVDHYGLDKEFESECRAWAKSILVIDDLADRPHDCDILMDQTFGRSKGDYQALVPAHCNVLTGAQYALLRPQFHEARSRALQTRKERTAKVENLLVMLSSADEHNVTGFVLDALEAIDNKMNIDVVMGGNAPHLAVVQQQIEKSHHHIKFHAGVSDIASLMAQADVAIGAGGTASWERCCLGLPTFVIEIADNQNLIIKMLHEAGAIHSLGRFGDIEPRSITHSIKQFQQRPEQLINMIEKAASICDGQGAIKLVEVLNENR